MIVTAWSNGSDGYGLKIAAKDRDQFFKREWETVYLVLEGEPAPIQVNVRKQSFWNGTCRELIHQEIGRWLQKNGLSPWAGNRPPEPWLEPIAERRFQLQRPL